MAEDKPKKEKKRVIGRPFVKGQIANPIGARAHDIKKREARKLTRQAIAEMTEEVIHGTVESLQAILKDKKQPAMKMMLASIVIRTIQKGDVVSFDNIMTQILGKQTEKLQISGDPMNPLAVQAVQVNIALPPNGRNAPNDPSINKEEKK